MKKKKRASRVGFARDDDAEEASEALHTTNGQDVGAEVPTSVRIQLPSIPEPIAEDEQAEEEDEGHVW